MSASATLSASASSSYTGVVSVTRKLRADLLQVLDHYGYFSGEHAESIVHDLRLLIDEGALDSIELTWRSWSSGRVLAAFRYDVVFGDIGLADDRPGGIPYRSDLKGAEFNVVVRYNAAGRALGAAGRQALGLKLSWGPAGSLDYSGGSWSNNRSYAADGVGLRRSAFS